MSSSASQSTTPSSFRSVHEYTAGSLMNKSVDQSALPTETFAAPQPYQLMAGCVIAVIVLAGLCAVAAVIYYIIFHTRLLQKGGGRRHDPLTAALALHDGGGGGSSGERGAASTHIFMFKKS